MRFRQEVATGIHTERLLLTGVLNEKLEKENLERGRLFWCHGFGSTFIKLRLRWSPDEIAVRLSRYPLEYDHAHIARGDLLIHLRSAEGFSQKRALGVSETREKASTQTQEKWS